MCWLWHTFKHHPCSDGIWECSCIGRCWVTSRWVPITFKDIRAAFLHGVTYQLCIDAMLAMLLKCGTSHALIKVLQSTAHSKLERTVYYICDTFHYKIICRFWNGRWTSSQHRGPQSRIDRMMGHFHGRNVLQILYLLTWRNFMEKLHLAEGKPHPYTWLYLYKMIKELERQPVNTWKISVC